jgi:tRNA(Ile)-lysidine synthase
MSFQEKRSCNREEPDETPCKIVVVRKASQRAATPATLARPLYFTPMPNDSGRAVMQAARRSARESDAPLLLAVSGGLDSMALLHAMATVAPERVAAVATFDHGTGPAARAAVSLASRTAAALGLPVVVGRLPADAAPAAGREAAWRRARYEFLRSAAGALGARIATAHTEDDQVETVLMRILRGSGTRGLAALYAAGDVARPFLGLRRSALERHVRDAGVHWRADPSNRSRAFLRNRIRLDLLPALRLADPGIDAVLLDVARRAARWRAQLDVLVAEQVRPLVTASEEVEIGRKELRALAPDSLAVVWGAVAGRVGLALDRRGTRRLTSFTISDAASGFVPLSGGWCVEASRQSFVLRRRPAHAEGAVTLPAAGAVHWGGFRFRVRDDADPGAGPDRTTVEPWSAALPLASHPIVRSWTAGDRLEPAAGQTRRRVKRYLTEAGVRGLDRAGWPVVVAGDDVVWIPGVRRSDAATERSGRPVRYYVCERIDR